MTIIFVHEFIGTAILILLGCGIGALVSLKASVGFGAGNWVLTSLGWGMAVYVGASVSWESGANLNPAVSFALTLNGTQTWAELPVYVAAQVLGAMTGACLVYILYKKQFDLNDSPETTGGIFYTGPSAEARSLGWNTISEAIATFVLVYWIVQQAPWEAATAGGAPSVGNIGLGYAGVAFTVIAVGAGLGGATGYALNPARDFGPRLAYSLLPIKGKQQIDWGYAWVPIVGPLLGGAAAAALVQMNF